MPTFTILKRNELLRAEQEDSVIQQFTVCGYEVQGEQVAESAEQAVAQFQAASQGAEKAPFFETKLRRNLMILLGVLAFMWFTYLIFGLLPTAFVE